MKIYIYPYKLGSSSCKILSDIFKARRVKPDGTYSPQQDHFIINWGNSTIPNWYHNLSIQRQILNSPRAIAAATNKLSSFENFKAKNISTVDWTTKKEKVQEWLYNNDIVIARHKLQGTGGEGIEEIIPGNKIPNVKLYTRFVPKIAEYRVHVFKNTVIEFTAKKKMTTETIESKGLLYNKRIRSHNNGWVFAKEGINISKGAELLAISAVKSLGLDFAAVDILETKNRRLQVLEVNCAPGLENKSTIEAYAKAIEGACNDYKRRFVGGDNVSRASSYQWIIHPSVR